MSPTAPRQRICSKYARLHHHDLLSIFRSNPRHNFEADLSSIYLNGPDSEVENRSYRILFPVVKQLLQLYRAHPELEKISEFRIACAVCSDPVQFRGWESLLLHAWKFWKRFPLQHQGYYRALKEAFKVEGFNPVPAEPVAWPPILLVENACLTFDGSLRRWKGLQGVDIPDNIKGIDIEEVLAVCKNADGDRRDVIAFPASEVGLVDAKKLTEVLENSKSGDRVNLRVESLRAPKDTCDTAPTYEQEIISGSSNAQDADDEDNDIEKEQANKCSTSISNFDYEMHRPLGNWATMKEIKQRDRVDSIRCKWANRLAGCREHCASGQTWPFRKSRKVG